MKVPTLNPSSIPFIPRNKNEENISDICVTPHDDSISHDVLDITIPPTKNDLRGRKNFRSGGRESIIQNNI